MKVLILLALVAVASAGYLGAGVIPAAPVAPVYAAPAAPLLAAPVAYGGVLAAAPAVTYGGVIAAPAIAKTKVLI